jgi:hypothetical protein
MRHCFSFLFGVILFACCAALQRAALRRCTWRIRYGRRVVSIGLVFGAVPLQQRICG